MCAAHCGETKGGGTMKRGIIAALLAVALLCTGCTDEPEIIITPETTELEFENIENPPEIVEQKQILEPEYSLVGYDEAVLDRAQMRIESNEMQEKIDRWLEWISADWENHPYSREYIENEIKYNLESIYNEADINNYMYYVIVKLRETDYDFNTEGKSAEEIIKILWEKNIVWFQTYYFYLTLFGNNITKEGEIAKFIHYFFDSFEDLKNFVESTYISCIAYNLLYEGGRNQTGMQFFGDKESLMRDWKINAGTYGYFPFYSAEQCRITNVTDNQIDFIFSYRYHPWIDDEYVDFEIEYTAVKENGKWLLTDFVGVASFWSMYQEMQGIQ
jgi:hypothetical protein